MFEVHCNYGAVSFENENDALSALWLIGLYHDIKIDRESARRKLNEYGYYEKLPLSIIKGE